MIIKSQRVASTASLRRLCDHVFRGEENQDVRILQGSERDVRDFWRDAQQSGSAFAIRHWQLCPEETTTDSQAFGALAKLAEEYQFPASRAVLVAHGKDRVTPEAADRHWHVLLGEVDPASGRVLSSSHDFARHEYLARLLEFEWGHGFVIGPHTKSVLARLRREDRKETVTALARALEASADAGRPKAAFDHRQHQAAKRAGIDLPEVREIVGAAWASCTDFAALKRSLAEAGLTLDPGDVAGEWIVKEENSDQHWSLRRLTRARKAAFAKRMQELIDGDEHGRTGQVIRRTNPGGDGRDPSGTRDIAPVRERPGPSADGAAGELHVDHDAPVRPAGCRDGGNAQTPRSPDRLGDGPSDDGGSTLGDPGALIDTAKASVTAAFHLTVRAQACARPMPEQVQDALDRQAIAAKAAPVPSTSAPLAVDLKALRAAEKSASADAAVVSSEIATINERMAEMIARERKRKGSPWRRWFPDQDLTAALAGLRDHRERLRASHSLLAHARLRAEIAARDGASEMVRLEARAAHERQAAKALAEIKLAILKRARALLARVPALAYVGARNLLRMATRIENAREQGWDPGPGTGFGT